MKARVLVVIAVLGLMVGTATPQTVAPQDVKAVLQAAATAMGINNLKTIQYTGAGTTRIFGQSFSVNDDWPRVDMPAYTRTIDFSTMYSREEMTRKQGNNPPRGGGFQPLQGDQKSIAVSSGKYSWNINPDNNNVTPALADAEQREIEIILTPIGFIKAAMEAKDATAVTMMMALDDGTIGKTAGPGGRKVTYVAFTALGKYKVSGAIDDQNMVERTQTWIGNPVLGDLIWQFDWKEYKDYAGVKFPSYIHQHAGDIRNTTHHGIDLRLTDLKANVAVAAVTVPDAVRNATAQPVRVASEKVADGVWLIAGGSHNSMAVEFKDFIAVVEAPLSEERSLAVIKETQRLIPNKPIRYLVMTHHHFDHSSGIRTYLAQGAILVMHQMDKDYFYNLAFYPYPRMMQPDVLSTYYPRFASNKFPVFETVNPSPENKAKLVVSDGKRTMEMHHVQGLQHAADMLMVYLPTERILVNADLYSPPAPGAAAPPPNPNMISLNNNIKRLKLDVGTHVPIHGRVGTNDEFVKIMGVSSN